MKKLIKLLILSLLLIALISPASTILADEFNNIQVVPGGEAFGVKMFSEGLIIIKTESFNASEESLCPATAAGLQVNDIILAVDNETIDNNKRLKEIIEQSKGKELKIKFKRNENILTTSLYAKKDSNGQYRAGMWVKDSAAGLGTVTFYSEELGGFCGLGHGICDTDTGSIIPISYGEAEKANITSVSKSKTGNIGSLNGYFTGDDIGEITVNAQEGVFGITSNNIPKKDTIGLAGKDEIIKGDAYIYTTLNGNAPKLYNIKITKIKKNDSLINMVIKITDEELLNECGGIVQGMSGSPIIQNGKLVGAVTHVLVDDVDTGYGIFAETMYNKMCETCR